MAEIIPFLEKKFEIPSYFVDDNTQLTVSSLFSLLQEMSNEHARRLNAGWQELRERGFFWVITRIRLKINRLPKWNEPVLLRTWVKESKAATSPRDYEMEDADGNILIAGTSIWAILDIEGARPQRMNMFDGCFLPQNRHAVDGQSPKIGALAIPEEPLNSKPVVHSDIDMNRHVNNARYIQWAIDSVNEDFLRSHRITSVMVKFLSQAKFGDRYSVCSEQLSETASRTTLYSPDDRREYCRLQFEWESLV